LFVEPIDGQSSLALRAMAVATTVRHEVFASAVGAMKERRPLLCLLDSTEELGTVFHIHPGKIQRGVGIALSSNVKLARKLWN
jgi:hypothetical protein